MTAFVFGFDRFGELPCNPSQCVVEKLASTHPGDFSCELVAEVLPTEYLSAEKKVTALIREFKPTVVLGLGVSRLREIICLERFALNIDDAGIQDNVGLVRQGSEIEKGGPPAVKTTANLPPILNSLVTQGVRAAISNHAGSYVCNHTYYRALRVIQVEKLETACVFVHLPMITEENLTKAQTAGDWTIDNLLLAARSILAELIAQQIPWQ